MPCNEHARGFLNGLLPTDTATDWATKWQSPNTDRKTASQTKATWHAARLLLEPCDGAEPRHYTRRKQAFHCERTLAKRMSETVHGATKHWCCAHSMRSNVHTQHNVHSSRTEQRNAKEKEHGE